MDIYTKSLSSDFGGNFNQTQFYDEINANINIIPVLQGIDITGDVINIIFDTPLSTDEQITLNTLISSHLPIETIGNNVSNITIQDNQIDLTTYITVGTFYYPGSKLWSNITNIKVISVMEDGGTSYDVKIYDVTNNNQIVLSNLNNTIEQNCDLGTLSNIPVNEAIFEIQAKINGSTIAHIKNLNIYYN